MSKSPTSKSSLYFQFSPKARKRSISAVYPEAEVETVNRSRSDSLEEQTIHNTTILNFNGSMHNAKIVDVDETNMIQIIFKYNNQYNRWKCKLDFKKNTIYDEKLANIYLKSFINTVQIVKCFIFDKNNYLLIDIVDKGRLTTAVTFIQERTNDIKNKNVRSMTCLQKICEKTAHCMSEAASGDIIEYDEYIRIIHNTNLSS